jgi:ADP-heptose:LPS heptosyltransferase
VQRFLIIQTAFLGDVVLATALIEKLRLGYPEAKIDFLLRKGNEHLLAGNLQIDKLYVWDKKAGKLRNLWQIAMQVRRARYSHVVNVHRHGTSGFVTWMSGASEKRGFSANPFSWSYTHKVEHRFSKPGDKQILHETDRNQLLIASMTDEQPVKPKLYPSPADEAAVEGYTSSPYICIAPSSVWATKRFPVERWAELMAVLPGGHKIYLLGGKEDVALGEELKTKSRRSDVENLSGKLSIIQSAVLMRGAVMNYANDSGPVHFASAVDAPMTAVFCSTHKCFGFGPLSTQSRLVELDGLYCKPCGIHGYPTCPQGHFRCAKDIDINALLWWTTPGI